MNSQADHRIVAWWIMRHNVMMMMMKMKMTIKMSVHVHGWIRLVPS